MSMFFRYVLAATLAANLLLARAGVRAQDGTAGDSVQKIAEDYQQQLLALDRQRLERLARLASTQEPAAAAATNEQLLRLAIDGNLFREAEPAAKAVLERGTPSATTAALARLVKIIALCDRGEYEASLASLRAAIAGRDAAGQAKASPAALLAPEKIELADAYFQRLIHAGQYQIASQAFTLLKDNSRDPQLARFLAARLARLDLVGKPTPPLRGTDLAGKTFDLAASRGKVVLVVFWATWCVPCSPEVALLREVAGAYRGKGFEVVSINVDTLQDGGQKHESVLPGVRRFLLEHNVAWPTLINGSGDADYARAYAVTEIPANVLIARDGTVAGLDLVRQNLQTEVARAVAAPAGR
jgi:thiol-disulfide isomerase/thioredoxin